MLRSPVCLRLFGIWWGRATNAPQALSPRARGGFLLYTELFVLGGLYSWVIWAAALALAAQHKHCSGLI